MKCKADKGGARLFCRLENAQDYDAFLRVLDDTFQQIPLAIRAMAGMPNVNPQCDRLPGGDAAPACGSARNRCPPRKRAAGVMVGQPPAVIRRHGLTTPRA
ncbi:MAG: hypothetical protein R6V12_06175 [Candidatus Hydrogenedentota bacterium]